MKAQQPNSAYNLSGCKIRKIFCIVKGLRWFILLYPGILWAQWSFDFEDTSLGEWDQYPPGRWEITGAMPLSGLYSLHHSFDNPGSGKDHIFIDLNYPVLDSSISFSFQLRHAYNPSSGNNWQVYFLSQHAYLLDNAFVFGVNFSGSDDMIKLWQVVDGELSELVNTGINYEEGIGRNNAPLFRIMREASGRWSVDMDVNGEGSQLTAIGEGREIDRQDGKYLGIRYSYSSAQDRKLWLDNIVVDGYFYQDNDPPGLQDIEVSGLNSLRLSFDEDIMIDEETDFQWSGLSPDSVYQRGSEIQLFFPKKFPNREEQDLKIKGVPDLEGNRMRDTLVSFMQNLLQFGELVINEIMSDPDPVVYLPDCEYIELLNLSDYTLNMEGWSLQVNTKTYTIEAGIVAPSEYLLLCSENQSCIFEDHSVSGLFSSNAVLSNSGSSLMIFDPYHRLIHSAAYKEMSYYSQAKESGGWSLECIDPERACGGYKNWSVSKDHSGGTPGRENSVYKSWLDMDPPVLKYIGLEDKNTVILHFSESLLLYEEGSANFMVQNKGSANLAFQTNPLVSDRISLTVEEPFRNGILYSINVSEISDCEGNMLPETAVDFVLPKVPEPGNIILNEIMYDAFIGQQEYIEFYNPSVDYIDLQDVKYGISQDSYFPGTLNWLSTESHLLAPGEHVVLTKNEVLLREQWDLNYDVDITEPPSWRVLANESATLSLLNRSELIMERFAYDDSMHHRLLMDPSGVSLERISSSPSSSWTSAAASVNYGTPGTRNSQWKDRSEEESMTSVDPAVFSPDLDGYQDICEIRLKNTPVGSVINIYITDMNGGEVIRLIENGISGQEDIFYWDGHDKSRNLLPPGIYVIYIRIAGELNETVEQHICAIAYR